MNDLLARLAQLQAKKANVGVYHDNGCLIGMSYTEYVVAQRDLALDALADVVLASEESHNRLDDAIDTARTILAALKGASRE